MYRQAFVACLRQSFLRAIHKGRENCGKVLLKEKNLTSRKTSEPKRETTMGYLSARRNAAEHGQEYPR